MLQVSDNLSARRLARSAEQADSDTDNA